MAETRKTAAAKETAPSTSAAPVQDNSDTQAAQTAATNPQANDTDTGGVTPVMAGRGQAGEAAPAVITNRVPRGVDEPPSDLLAEEPGARALQEAVRDKIDAETEKGYRGVNTDPTPNYNYTLKGVGENLPTPETVVITPTSGK